PGWSMSLRAGRDFSAPNAIIPGVGVITFEGSGSLEGADGQLNLLAGRDIVVNGGYIRTVAGGSIEVSALSGNVNTGTRPNGFDFRPGDAGYIVDADLGGISTAAGGNVKITAGKDITSYLPLPGGVQ